MTNTVYLYGRAIPAGKHLIEATALDYATERCPTNWAGQDALRVELTTPMPSTGERLLWHVLQALSAPGYTIPGDLAEHLDTATLRTVHMALGMAWGFDSTAAATANAARDNGAASARLIADQAARDLGAK